MKTATIGGPNAGRREAPVPAGHYKSSPGDKPPSPQKTARRNSPAAPLPAPFRKGQERGLQEVPPAGEAMSADGNRTREAPASRRSGRGGSLPNGAAALMLESVVMRWIFVLYQGERAFYAGSVLFWYSLYPLRRRKLRMKTAMSYTKFLSSKSLSLSITQQSCERLARPK